MYQRYLDGETSGITLSSTKGERGLELGRDYYLYNASHLRDLDLTGEVVCVGEGSRKDFEAVEVKGRWVLALHAGRPLGSVVRRAEQGGAIGLIATPGPEFKSKPYAERYGKSAESMKTAGSARFSPPRAESKFPQLMLDASGAEALYALSPESWAEGGPPVGQSLGVNLHEIRKIVDPVIQVSNVCAFWPGKEGARAEEVMVLSAHYDHVGVRGEEICNGADDNASGTVGLLGLADALVAYGPLERSVLLLWVSGEERGLWGSEVWSKDPWLPEGCRPVVDINIDMIGRTKPDELYITPSREHQAFNTVAEAAYGLAELEGFAELQGMDSFWRRSDHYNFHENLQIPVVFISSGDHPDYHKPTDTADKIDYEKMARTVRLIMRLLDRVQGEPLEK